MNPKSGTAGTPVSPAAPDLAEDADVADPGKIAAIKAEQQESKSGKYGSEKIKPHKSPEEDQAATEEKEEQKSWIEIELIDEDDKPVAGEKYKITLPDSTVAQGTLDEKGFARIEGIESGTCKITFPMLDESLWEPA